MATFRVNSASNKNLFTRSYVILLRFDEPSVDSICLGDFFQENVLKCSNNYKRDFLNAFMDVFKNISALFEFNSNSSARR